MNEGELIFAAGALAGAIGSLWFIARSVPRTDTEDGVGKRKLAMMLVLAIYAAMTLVAVIIGIVFRDTGVVGAAGFLFLLAVAGLALVWRSDAA